jgi:hypothetical protein
MCVSKLPLAAQEGLFTTRAASYTLMKKHIAVNWKTLFYTEDVINSG